MSLSATDRVLVWADRDRRRGVTTAAAVFLLAAAVLRWAGVPAIDLHGPLHYLGIMDPLCGGTRAAFLLLSGNLEEAARYNPIVFPLAAVVVALLARTGIGVLGGRWLEIRLPRAWRHAVVAILVLAVAVLSARQQMRADLLMQAWVPPGG